MEADKRGKRGVRLFPSKQRKSKQSKPTAGYMVLIKTQMLISDKLQLRMDEWKRKHKMNPTAVATNA